MLLLLLLCGTAAGGLLDPDSLPPLSEEMIRYVNEQSGARWKAANSSKFRTVDDILPSVGAFLESEDDKSRRPAVHHVVGDNELPESFDARDKWPHCASTIGKVRDQAHCASCWAFVTTGAMSDRACIASGGEVTVELSVIHFTSCCWECGNGCHGGKSGPAWDYWTRDGVVTGSSMEEGSGCQPYPFPKCTHAGKGTRPHCPTQRPPAPMCKRTCQQGYTKSYEDDKYYGSSSYNLPKDEKQIRKEIMTRGPVSAAFIIYDDFLTYKSGVYHHIAGGKRGGHMVKLIGWGVENNTPYWLAMNSWNEEWGENGLVRIYRGRNECEIERYVKAGLAKI